MIDAHVHVIPPALRGKVEPVPSMTGGEPPPEAILSPWVALLGRPDVNDAMAELDGPVLGAAVSADELRDVMSGPFAGVEITAKVEGAFLGAERFAPFWAAAEETGALVFVHPTTRDFAGPDDHYLWNTVGNPMETTICAAHLVMNGVLERHPGVKILLAHAGGAVLALRGRLRFASRAIAAARGVDVDASLRRLHYDTITHDPALLRAVVDFAGPEQVLAGSDHPFDMADPDPAATVRAAGLGASAAALVLHENAERLLGMTSDAQIVVAGAGHNSLITAAYLALAGYSVVVLDSRAIPGGGAASEELLGPGYVIDSCSTGHTLIQTNPLLVDDELGLLARYGLEYIQPDPFAHVAFPDGTHLTAWLDRERTVEEIARFSRHDAEAYGRFLDEYDEVKHLFSASQFTPVGFGPPLEQRLAEHPRGSIWLRRRAMSAWDVIRHEFEDEHVQAFLLWQAYQTLVPVDSDGSGQLAYSLVFGRQRRSWTIPRGGSGALTEAIVACIEEHGGTVVCNRRVTRLLLEGGRCAGVETEDGSRYRASEAVVSTIHVKHLLEMAPREVWDEGFRYGVETFDVGVSAMAVYLATTAPPVFADGNSAVSAGLAGFPRDVIEYGRALRDGRYVEDPAWLLVACPTLVDPSRAPEGRHTVKLLSAQSYGFPERKEAQADRQIERLRRVAPGFDYDARLVKAPEDIEAGNEHMIRGTFHGGNRTYPQSGALRPAPGWASHRMPIPGLYQTGGTTHPGGSITGAPGRNAAVVLLQDLGHDLQEVVRGAGRARAVGH